jgi:hypothetical protein
MPRGDRANAAAHALGGDLSADHVAVVDRLAELLFAMEYAATSTPSVRSPRRNALSPTRARATPKLSVIFSAGGASSASRPRMREGPLRNSEEGVDRVEIVHDDVAGALPRKAGAAQLRAARALHAAGIVDAAERMAGAARLVASNVHGGDHGDQGGPAVAPGNEVVKIGTSKLITCAVPPLSH